MNAPLVREYTNADLMHFERIHEASELDYKFPDLSSPLFICKTVIERAGKPTTLIAGRLEVETYLMSSGGPADKWEDIRLAQPAYMQTLWEKGIDSSYCVVPPEVDKHFAKRMRSLGWQPARNWFPWTRETDTITP